MSEELDNPTEWGAMIGTALLEPARQPEIERKASVKLAVQSKIFCDCGIVLDQETAVCLVMHPDKVRSVACPNCMKKDLKTALESSVERYGEDHARRTITEDFAMWTWAGVITGEELWSYASTTPRKPRAPRAPKTGRLTPMEIRDCCKGWTTGAEVVISGTYCMRTIPERAKALTKGHTEEHLRCNYLPKLVRQFEQWCNQGYGAQLTGTPEPMQDGETIACTAFKDDFGAEVCQIDTRLRLTVEHYCGPGQWRADRENPAAQARYVHANGRILAIVAALEYED